MTMQASFERSSQDEDIMSEQSLVAPTKIKKIVMGRSRGVTPSSWRARPTSTLASMREAGARYGPATASPFRGPGRFLTLNLDGSAKGGEEVARQSQLLMQKLRAGSVPTRPRPESPRKAAPTREKENENRPRQQSSSPARVSPTKGGAPLTRSPLAPRQQAAVLGGAHTPSPVVAAAGRRRPVLDGTLDTDLNSGAPRFVTSTCHKAVVAQSKITPTDRVTVKLKKLAPAEVAGKSITGKEKATATEERVTELFPSLDRTDSGNFNPTPPIYRLHPHNKHVSEPQLHKGPEVDSHKEVVAKKPAKLTREQLLSHRDSDADLGFGEPPPKTVAAPPPPHKDLSPPQRGTPKKSTATDHSSQGAEPQSDFNFAKPMLPLPAKSNGARKKGRPKGGESGERGDVRPVDRSATSTVRSGLVPEVEKVVQQQPEKRTYLDLWMPRLKGKNIYIEGNILDSKTGEYSEERWGTSKIVTRLAEKVVATKKGTVYVLEGNLTERPSELGEPTATPTFIVDRFARGFPENWEQLVKSWVAWLQRQQEGLARDGGRAPGFIFNSTRLLQTPQCPGGMSMMSNVTSMSSMTAIEASRFLPENNRTSCVTCPNCQTVIGPQEVSMRPELNAIAEVEETDTSKDKTEARGRPGSLSKTRDKETNAGGRTSGERSQEREVCRGRVDSKSRERAGELNNKRTSEANSTAERVSRSRQKSSNVNSTKGLNMTMTMKEINQLRAGTYDNTVTKNSKRTYNCNFCDYNALTFAKLKQHIQSNHLQGVTTIVPSPRKAKRRSRTADVSQLFIPSPEQNANTDKRKSKSADIQVRRSQSLGRNKRISLEQPPLLFPGIEVKGDSYTCIGCKFKSNSIVAVKVHVETKKHQKYLETVKKRTGEKRKSLNHLSKSPSRKSARPSLEQEKKNKRATNVEKPSSLEGMEVSAADDDEPTQRLSRSRQRRSSLEELSGSKRPIKDSVQVSTSKRRKSMDKKSKERRHESSETAMLKDRSKERRGEKSKERKARRSQERTWEKSRERIGGKSKDRVGNKLDRPSERSEERANDKSKDKRANRSNERIKERPKEKTNELLGEDTSSERTRNSSTPGIGLYTCFACNVSTDDDSKILTHLASPSHGKKVKSLLDNTELTEKNLATRYLHCDKCKYSSGNKGAYVKHIGSLKHAKAMEAGETQKKTTRNPSAVVEAVDMSMFGRKRKKTKALMRKSCVYDTPELEDDVETEEPVKKKKSIKSTSTNENVRAKAPSANDELRRKVLDPKKVLSEHRAPPPKVTKSKEEILLKMSNNPKTVKQRQQNLEAVNELNADHEDDLFKDSRAVKSKQSAFKASTKTLLVDSDSDSDGEVTISTAKTPVAAHLGSKGMREVLIAQEKTPAEVTHKSSPILARGTKYQQQAYIHKKILEKRKQERATTKERLTSALTSKSRAAVERQVDESRRVISSLTLSQEPEEQRDEEADDWFHE